MNVLVDVNVPVSLCFGRVETQQREDTKQQTQQTESTLHKSP